MGRYEEILRRNEQLIDNVYEMNEEITDLACENEELTKENEVLSEDNEILNEQNADMKKGIADLHKQTARRVGNRRYTQPQQTVPQQEKTQIVTQGTNNHNTISLYVSEKTKKKMLFGSLILLIALLALGIEPGVALTYESILDRFLELAFNLYKICILGTMGYLLRRIWRKIK